MDKNSSIVHGWTCRIRRYDDIRDLKRQYSNFVFRLDVKQLMTNCKI